MYAGHASLNIFVVVVVVVVVFVVVVAAVVIAVVVIMVAVVAIILPSPTKAASRPDRTIIMVMTVGIDAYVAFVSVFITVPGNNIINSTATIIITIVAI